MSENPIVTKTRSLYRIFILCSLAFLNAACGGGGGSSKGGSSSSDGDGSPGGSTGLEGTLIFEKVVNKIHQYNLATNEAKEVLELDGVIGVDESQNLIFVEDDFQVEGDGVNFRVTTHTMDRNGNVISSFVKPGSFTLDVDPKVSPDGSVIAMYYEPENLGIPALVLVNRNGDTLRYYEDQHSHIRAFDWSPSGVLYIAEDDSIYKVDFQVGPGKQLVRKFNNSHVWDTLSISPNGMQVAFSMSQTSMTRGSGYFDLYVMNVDGTNLRVMVNNEEHDIHGAAWSPDGKHLAITRGIDVHDAIQPCRGALYIIKATAANLTLDENSPDVISLVDTLGDRFCSNPASVPIWADW
ncbi:TolB family protein [Hahella sp. NBU794]|uniref:TolB family protein n=1 Tax=Hahella sp. NBU794 TaxID=3422590 RepID=UPI003D6FC481